uniref:Uncharacterized protein n=1 Tax=Arundo donax TaxID=35708 RepID=A0A0A9DJF4_ARUDO
MMNSQKKHIKCQLINKTNLDSRDGKSWPEPWEAGSPPVAGDSPSRLALPANCPFRRCILIIIRNTTNFY